MKVHGNTGFSLDIVRQCEVKGQLSFLHPGAKCCAECGSQVPGGLMKLQVTEEPYVCGAWVIGTISPQEFRRALPHLQRYADTGRMFGPEEND